MASIDRRFARRKCNSGSEAAAAAPLPVALMTDTPDAEEPNALWGFELVGNGGSKLPLRDGGQPEGGAEEPAPAEVAALSEAAALLRTTSS